VRRGVLLYLFGYFLNWVWNGTIIVFYGAFFVAGAVLFTLRARWLVAIGTSAAVAAAAIRWWAVDRAGEGFDTSWLLSGSAADTQSPRELIFDLAVRGTHPLLPWLLFLCMGIVLGRLLPFAANRRVELGALGAMCLGFGYMLREAIALHPTLESTSPFDRGLLYSLTTVGSTLLALVLIGAVAEATSGSVVTRALGVAGRTTLTLYVGHVLVFNLLVHWLEWVQPRRAGHRTAVRAGLLGGGRGARRRLEATLRHRSAGVGVPPVQRRTLTRAATLPRRHEIRGSRRRSCRRCAGPCC
jgi:uncharacterized protein